MRPVLPMPGERYVHQSGEVATVIASCWMVDSPDEDGGCYVAVLVLLNAEPDYYTVAWVACDVGQQHWTTDDANSYPNIVGAAAEYAETTQ